MAGYLKPVRIVGGGLAGLALGVALRRRGVEVALHEAGSYPRHRVCGEFVSGVGDSTLEKLGIARHMAHAVPLRTAKWFCDRGAVASLEVSARGISRHQLDDSLRRDFEESGGHLHMSSRQPPGGEVVWAAGRVRQKGKWVGLKCHLRGIELAADLEMHLGRSGYVGLAKVEGGKVNVCGLFRAGAGGPGALVQSLRDGGLDRLAQRILDAEVDPGSQCAVAGFGFGRQSGPEFAIGDAAQMIPPFTGNGMSMAFESAALALDPLLEFAAGRIGWPEAAGTVRSLQRRAFGRRMAAAIAIQTAMERAPGLVCLLARQGCLPTHLLLRLVR